MTVNHAFISVLLWLGSLPVFAGKQYPPMDEPPSCVDAVIQPEPFRWGDFSREWRTSIRMLLLGEIRLAGNKKMSLWNEFILARRNEDHRIKRLEKLGFDFSQIENGHIRIPHLFEVANVFFERLRQWVGEKKIPMNETLIPGVLVKKEDGNAVPLRIGREKFDVTLVDLSAKPALFTEFIKKGFFPLSANLRVFHDLSHLSGMLESPDYMRGIFQMATDFGRSHHPLPLRDRYIRFFHAFESAFFLQDSAKSVWEKESIEQIPTVSVLQRSLVRRTREDLVAHAQELLSMVERQGITMGGAFEIGVHYSDAELSDSVPWLYCQLRRAIRAKEMPKKHLATHIARLEVSLRHLAKLSVNTFFEELRQTSPNPRGSLYRMYVISEVGSSGPPHEVLGGNSPLYLTLKGELNAEHESAFGSQYARAKSKTAPTQPEATAE